MKKLWEKDQYIDIQETELLSSAMFSGKKK